MELIQSFLNGITLGPLQHLLELLRFSPDRLLASLVFFAIVLLLNDLVRTALMVEHTRSVLTHMIVDILTIWPGVLLGVALLLAGARYPDRAWLNLGLALVLYFFWWLGGTLTWLSRRDTEGADVGWISHGGVITVVLGLLAVVIY